MSTLPKPNNYINSKSSYGTHEDSESEPLLPGGKRKPQFSKFRMTIIFLILFTTNFISALDSMIVTTLTRPLIEEFQAPSLVSWLGSSFFIASAVSQPLCGQMTDVFSRRTGSAMSTAMFLIGNLLCGFAPCTAMIVAGRALSGFGGGAMVVITTVVITDVVSPDQRGYWQGLGNIFYGLGHGFGGVFGGWMCELINWRVAFYAMVPLALLVLVGSIMFIPSETLSDSSHDSQKQVKTSAWDQVDFVGLAILPVGLCLLLCGVNVGAFEVGWKSSLTISLLVGAALALVTFAMFEIRYAKRPILPVKLLMVPAIGAVCATNWLATSSISVAEFYLPQLFQYQGSQLSEAGMRVAPISFGAAVGSFAAGLASTRYPTRNLSIANAGLILTMIPTWLFTKWTANTSGWMTAAITSCCGLGFGAVTTATLVAVLKSTRQEDQATLTSMLYMFRATGGAIGIAAAGALSRSVLSGELEKSFEGNEGSHQMIEQLLRSWQSAEELPETLFRRAQLCKFTSLRSAFKLNAGFAMASLSVGILWAMHSRWSARKAQGST